MAKTTPDSKKSGHSVRDLIRQFNDTLEPAAESTAVILAAGHGKRIKSERSKMLHKIWGKTTVERVTRAARRGLSNPNLCVVVGIKAESVIETVGKQEKQAYAYQEEQKGTGHAVQVALDALPEFVKDQNIFVFPGDIGLIREHTISVFAEQFKQSDADMAVLTGYFTGDPEENYYGRIVREGTDGETVNDGHVLKIMESKDILAMDVGDSHSVASERGEHTFTRQELLEISEFNTGIFAFRGQALGQFIHDLNAENIQGELYVTDLIEIFNKNGLAVQAFPTHENQAVLGFNNKSVLKEMNSLYQKDAYEKLKDIVTFRDPQDFFINDEMVEKLLDLDKNGETLDIRIGKSVYINGNLDLSPGLDIKDNVHITGNVRFGKNVTIHKNVELSTYPDQSMVIGDNTTIFQDDIIKGNTQIGSYCRIESGVNVTGSDKYPTRIGDKVMIKGTSYIFGSTIEENAWIEHCVLKTKKVHCHYNRNGEVAPIRYVIPHPEGLDDVESIGDDREEYSWPPDIE